MRYPRGSEWRRWDLQVHTPFSALNNGFGSDFDSYLERLFQAALKMDVAVVGVTDYFSIEGYKRLREVLADDTKLTELAGKDSAERVRQILWLPNIEFRTSVIVRRPGGDDSRVNLHFLFSDQVDPATIEEHFLRELKFTAESSPGGADEKWSLTLPNLNALGQRLRDEHPPFRDRDDLFIGMMNAVVSHEDVTAVVSRQASRFDGKYLVMVPADEDLSECSWDGQGHLARKLMIQKAHMLLSGNAGTRAFGLGKRHGTPEEFIQEFSSLKPCVHSSDAHEYDSLFEPALQRYTWIKADPTFLGLRRVLLEPESRVFIGQEPPTWPRVKERATKFITDVTFARTEDAEEGERWFSGTLPINTGLVAVIGNKGSGKSALTDALGLVGNSSAHAHFSFLHQDRFLKPKGKLGSMFTASVRWQSGAEATLRLDSGPVAAALEAVKYLPQSYLEKICSELRESSDTPFDREMMEVIFSHVQEAEKLGRQTLAELIEYLTTETEQRIRQLQAALEDLNAKITSLEERASQRHQESLEARLAKRQSELAAHNDAQPPEVTPPNEDNAARARSEAINAQLAGLEETISQLQAEQVRLEGVDASTTARITRAEKLLVRLSNLERNYEQFLEESQEDEEALGIRLEDVVSLEVHRDVVGDVRQRAEDERSGVREQLRPEAENSIPARLEAARAQAADLRSQLDEPQRLYQEYLEKVKAWQGGLARIEGSAAIPDSIKGLETQIEALADLPSQLDALTERRTALCGEILESKTQLVDEYKRLHAPVQDFIERHPLSREEGALQFRAAIAVEGCIEGLLTMLHQGRTGSFYGEDEGRERLRHLLEVADFGSAENTLTFIESVLDHLTHDRREEGDHPVEIGKQLRKGYSVADVYDFLFGLSYLQPRFELGWQGKPLDQLSPGERGNLLLIFYLLIDKRDIPLIIDQPEENLDNHTLARMLVPAIKEAKERRQIILVTHNPNLSVVCDADQVIHASIDKTAGNLVNYLSGSLEEPVITQLIVDVQEGTKPAFDLRDEAYAILDTLK